MEQSARTRIVLHVVETVYALGAAAWIALPLAGAGGVAGVGAGWGSAAVASAATWLAWAFAVVAAGLLLWKVFSIPLERALPVFCDPIRPVAILPNIVLSAGIIALLVVPMLRDAASGRWFAALPLPQYGVFAASLAWNATSAALLLGSMNRRDPSYREYLAFRRAGGARTPIAGLTPHGIQQRLALTYIPLILVVIVVLSWVLMRDYSSTLLETVIDGGLSLAERTAGTVKANADDLIAVEDILEGEAARNRGAHLPFGAISLYWKAPRTGTVAVAVSTDDSREGTDVPAGDEPAATGYRLLDDDSLYEFRSPVVLGGKSLGWVGVEYSRDVIYEPVFRSQVKVTVIAALFVYAAVFLTWVFGQAVVFPILYLRMSVSSIREALDNMIAGRTRVSPDRLQYRDLVTTRDEIRSLSGEIGNMTTVIRGVLPYISASTLHHAGQGKAEGDENAGGEGAMSDLALLFTDIRGFTAFSEDKSPQKVIDALNRCHELQATAILDNHGDIDNVVGDGLFARFDGPEKELNACRAAFAIRDAMREARRTAGANDPTFAVGIGISAGLVVTGPVGARERRHFTAVGNRVNLASRLEGANKIYGTWSLVTDSVVRVARAFLFREIDLVAVKGMQKPVRIHELLGAKAKAGPRTVELARVFAAGLAAYRAQQWQTAAKSFTLLAEKYKDPTSRLFLARIRQFASRPPSKDWNGVSILTMK
ncbi:MAG: adenylate/guanylate cyclase domain-containing protein [Spirochaetes bacterium]|nr:adenylate/guanylate cyclase domain-containing protein [Spirochaetota bacterium]